MDIRESRLQRSAWDAAIGAAALQHGWAYGAIVARYGARLRRFEIEGDGFAQVLCRRVGPLQIGYLPVGVHWTGAERPGALLALRGALSAFGPTVLVAPGPPERLAPALAGPREMAVLDIARDASARRAAMAKKWRNRLRHAEAAALRIETVRDIPDWLIACERRQQRARRYANLPRSWIEAWRRIAPGAAFATIAWDGDGAPVAAMAFVTHGAAATYLLGWSGLAGRAASAHNLLLSQATELLAARGIRRLDLGQIDRKAQPGIARFKLGCGARVVVVPKCRAIGPWSGRAGRSAHHPMDVSRPGTGGG